MSCSGCHRDEAKVVVAWRAWYADGSEYSSDQLGWEELPDDGVLAATVCFADGTRRVMSGAHWYFRTPDDAFDTCHTLEYAPELEEGLTVPEAVERRYPGASVKRGKLVPDSMYVPVLEKAHRAEAPR